MHTSVYFLFIFNELFHKDYTLVIKYTDHLMLKCSADGIAS